MVDTEVVFYCEFQFVKHHGTHQHASVEINTQEMTHIGIILLDIARAE
jgi:hypothetical protein